MTMGSAGRIATLAAAALLSMCAAASAQDRSLDLYNMNTRESLSVTYKRDGRWDEEALGKLDWFLRDWRKGKSVRMDRKLYDVVWEIREQAGSRAPIHVHSGYRSKATNSLLRSRSKGVARHSQHINGTALDFHIPGVPAKKLREIALRMQDGGVGYYPKANNPFVHVDVADVRHWPRMTRKQLTALFPDGLTVHVPSDGKPLKGFREALAMLTQGRKPAPAVPASRRQLASLDPESIPVPSFRPDLEAERVSLPARAFAALGLDSGIGDGPAGFSAYVPPQPGPGLASSRFLEPVRTVPESMAIIRKPLASPAEAASEAHRIQPGPALVDLGVGKKGDRLPRPGGSRQADAAGKWKLGGLL